MLKTLSIIVPVYNEAATLLSILEKIKNVKLLQGLGKEIIIINDGSSDNSEAEILKFIDLNKDLSVKYLKHIKNIGKGAAIRTGINEVSGDIIIIQDGDLEYDPEEYNILLQPLIEGRADVVYGSRFMGGKPHRVLFFWHSIGNKFLTFFSNIFTNLNLTDMEAGLKLFRKEVFKDIRLQENGFGFEVEITARIARIKGIRIYEVGISYYGRTYEEGKKINWKDGVRAIYCILKYNLFS